MLGAPGYYYADPAKNQAKNIPVLPSPFEDQGREAMKTRGMGGDPNRDPRAATPSYGGFSPGNANPTQSMGGIEGGGMNASGYAGYPPPQQPQPSFVMQNLNNGPPATQSFPSAASASNSQLYPNTGYDSYPTNPNAPYNPMTTPQSNSVNLTRAKSNPTPSNNSSIYSVPQHYQSPQGGGEYGIEPGRGTFPAPISGGAGGGPTTAPIMGREYGGLPQTPPSSMNYPPQPQRQPSMPPPQQPPQAPNSSALPQQLPMNYPLQPQRQPSMPPPQQPPQAPNSSVLPQGMPGALSPPAGAWGHHDPNHAVPSLPPLETSYGQQNVGVEGTPEMPFTNQVSTPLSLQRVKNDGHNRGSVNAGGQPSFVSTSFSRMPVSAALPPELLRIHRIPLGTELENPEIPHLLPQHLVEDYQRSSVKQSQPKIKPCALRTARPTSIILPGTKAVSDLIPLPVGITISPMADGDTLPIVSFPQCKQMIRCRSCGAYLNAYTVFTQQGYQFQCVCCRALCNVPPSYHCSLDPQTGMRMDREQRPELTHCSVDFQATPEFLTSPPRRQVFILLLDCSHAAVASGLLSSMCSGALRALEQLKTEEQLQMGIIGYDSLVHFFRVTETDEPEMISSPDIVNDVSRIVDNFHLAGVELPCPVRELVVSVKDGYKHLRHVLTKLPTMFGMQSEAGCAFGPALNAVMTVLSNSGGKVIAGLTSNPVEGEGAVKPRFDMTKLSNQPKEHTVCQAGTEWYKNRALSCSAMSISVDLVVAGTFVTEFASILPIARYTSGHVYHQTETNKGGLSRTVEHCLTRFMASDAIMRVRASTGVTVSSYYGHFHVAEVDLLTLPIVDEDMTYAVELTITPQVKAKYVYVQFSTVYTSRSRERRIRVHTIQLRVGDSLTSVINSMDCLGLTSMLCRSHVDRAMSTPFATVRTALTKSVGTVLRNVQVQLNLQGVPRSQADLNVPTSLKYLPQILAAFLRYAAIGGALEKVPIPPSVRLASMSMILTSRAEAMVGSMMGWTYTLHNPRLPLEELPSFTHSSISRFAENTVQLTHAGTSLIVWVGQRVDRTVLEALHLQQPRRAEEMPLDQSQDLSGLYERMTDLAQYLRDVTQSCYFAAIEETPQGNTIYQTELQRYMQESNCAPLMAYQTFLKLLWTESGPKADKK